MERWPQHGTREYWERMVRGSTHGATDTQVGQMVDLLVARQASCVWHALSMVTGKPCWCRDCRPDIRRFA